MSLCQNSDMRNDTDGTRNIRHSIVIDPEHVTKKKLFPLPRARNISGDIMGDRMIAVGRLGRLEHSELTCYTGPSGPRGENAVPMTFVVSEKNWQSNLFFAPNRLRSLTSESFHDITPFSRRYRICRWKSARPMEFGEQFDVTYCPH